MDAKKVGESAAAFAASLQDARDTMANEFMPVASGKREGAAFYASRDAYQYVRKKHAGKDVPESYKAITLKDRAGVFHIVSHDAAQLLADSSRRTDLRHVACREACKELGISYR